MLVAARSFDHLRPGARAAVLSVALAIVLVSALVTAESVSGHLTRTATDEAIRSAEAVVRAYVDPLLSAGAMHDPAGALGGEINGQLERLVGSGSGLLRIKVWAADGTVLFSDLPALRGARYEVGEELMEALEGETASEVSTGDKPENVFEQGLADHFLEIYLPVRDPTSGLVVGAYEIYEDAAPIERNIAATRQDVFLVALLMAAAILILLYLAFAGTWARLVRTNQSLRRLTGEVRHSEARFRSLVQNSRDIFAVLDTNGVVTYESAAIRHVLGYEAGRVGRSLLEFVHPGDAKWARGILADVVARPGSQRNAEPRVRHADGSWRVMEWTLTNLLDDPAIGGVVLNSRDISERKALEEQLSHQALHDPLTGLANRALFADRVEHALARRDGRHKGVAVLFLDLDDFRTVNDSLGHEIGDRLLVGVAERLRAVLRPADTVAHMGGDEFAILVDEPVTAEAPAGVAERVLDAVREPLVLDRRAVTIQTSIGIAWTNGRRVSATDLLRDAEVAMYAAKRAGKNRYEVFETGMRAAALARIQLKADLERALRDNELLLHYQPIVSLQDGRVVGVEALVRWNHPERGLLAPEWFIQLAEETGQIVPLGGWVLAAVCRQAAEWKRIVGREVPVAINLSARELQDGALVDHVRARLAAAGLDPGSLTVEVTESVWVEEVETSGRVLEDLRALGVHLAIDDFGIGYSSLSYLQRFPFDSLKIDRSFVAALASDGAGETLVRSIVDLGARLGRTVVAEGIERSDQLAALRRLGCEFGQGNFLARPAEPAKVTEILLAGDVGLRGSSVRPSARRGNGRAGRAVHEPIRVGSQAGEP